MKRTLRDLAGNLGCHLLGDGSIAVTHVSSLRSANHESLVFVDDPKHLDAALTSPAAAIIAWLSFELLTLLFPTGMMRK